MVDGLSASASEIVSGALQDHHRATILGSRTFGKGLVQTVLPLSHQTNAQVKLTTLRYLPSGRLIQREDESTQWGVDPTPGFFVPETDDQLADRPTRRRDLDVLRRRADPGADRPAGAMVRPRLGRTRNEGPALAGLRVMRTRVSTGKFRPISDVQARTARSPSRELRDLEGRTSDRHGTGRLDKRARALGRPRKRARSRAGRRPVERRSQAQRRHRGGATRTASSSRRSASPGDLVAGSLTRTSSRSSPPQPNAERAPDRPPRRIPTTPRRILRHRALQPRAPNASVGAAAFDRRADERASTRTRAGWCSGSRPAATRPRERRRGLTRVRSNIIASQHDRTRSTRASFRDRQSGPRRASRRSSAGRFEAAGVSLTEIELIAVGNRPGLIGSLLVGVAAAKGWPCRSAFRSSRWTTCTHLYAGLLGRTATGARCARSKSSSGAGAGDFGRHTSLYLCQSPTRCTHRRHDR